MLRKRSETENWICPNCPFLPERDVCLCKRLLEALVPTVLWVRRDFLTPVVLPWSAFLLSELWRLGGVESVFMCPSTPILFLPWISSILSTFSECLWLPFCWCSAEGPEAKEQIPAQTGRGSALESEAAGPCSKVFACWGLWGWLGLREGRNTSKSIACHAESAPCSWAVWGDVQSTNTGHLLCQGATA